LPAVSDEPILLIEDSRASPGPASRALEQLRGRPYAVVTAGSLAEGIEQLSARRFAAAIVDLALPDAEGMPALLRLQSKSGTVPIIVLVDRTQEELGVEATRRGALDYLIKDEIAGSLLDKVLRLALERTHTVLALRASEARYRTMFESTAAGVYQATCDDRLITINPAFVALLGYASEDEVLKLDFGTEICANYEDHLDWRRDLEGHGEMRSRETTLRNKAGDRLVVLHSARLVRDSRGAPLYYEGTIADVTAAHSQARQWSYEASHDSLTGLLNRREMERRMQSALENAAIDRGKLAAVMIDLDGFKKVNDRFGHTAGDDFLRHIAGALRKSVRAGDLIARFGGDEFLVLLEHSTEESAMRVARAMLKALESEQFLWAGQALYARASLGIGMGSGQDPTWLAILERADVACYDAKTQGGSRVKLFQNDGSTNLRVGRARQLALTVTRALEEDQLRLQAQRIAPIRNRRAHGHYEIVIQMSGPDQEDGTLDVSELAAEHPILARRLDRWCIEASCRWIARNQHANPAVDRWFLNLTPASFEDPDLAQFVDSTAREAGVAPRHLGIEIEEQALGSCLPQVSELVQKLAGEGFSFTLDGFGRGISSFAYLKSLPVSYVKLDYAAIVGGTAPGGGTGKRAESTLLRSLHQINRALGRATIMDCVGSRELLREMAAAGVDYAQGPAVGEPVALKRRRNRTASHPG
jgi:diguanylate cyclase (GGDEF)-like protein/PAS domain S-box-containing protein